MITEFDMYLITRATNVHNALFTVGLVCSIAFPTVGFFLCAMGNDCEWEDMIKAGKRVIRFTALSIVVFLLSALIPTTKDLCAIKVVPAIVNNEAVGEIAAGAKELALEWMRDQIDSLKKKE